MPSVVSRVVSLVSAVGLALFLLIGTLLAGSETASRRTKLGRIDLPGIDLGLSPATSLEVVGGRRRGGLPILERTSAALRHRAGRVVVKFRPAASADARATARAVVHSTDATPAPWGDFEILALAPTADAAAAAALLAARPDVEYAQVDALAVPYFRPNNPLYAQQWNLPALQLEQAWDINAGASASVIVAVLDGGVAFDTALFEYDTFPFRHEGRLYPSLGRVAVPFAVAPELGAGRFVAPRDFIWNDTDPVDLHGHGTHVAGTIGQLTNNSVGVAGVAFNVRLMPVKVIAEEWDLVFDAPNVGTAAIVASGIRYAADNGARVINMSLGFDTAGPLPVVEDALAYAVGKGAVVVVAAGNSFEDGNPVESLAEIAARLDGVISVGAVDRDLNRAYYSSSRSSVELTAPGGSTRVGGAAGAVLQQTFDEAFSVRNPLDAPASAFRAPRFDVFAYAPSQGTSMAAPHVAGVVALLMQQGLTDPAAIEAALKRFATDRGATGRDDDYGYGLVNARQTLRGLGLAR